MAVRSEVKSDEEPSKSVEGAGPKSFRKPENVDALVSRFLAELNDLSTEIGQPDNQGRPAAQTAPSTLPAQEKSGPAPVPDLDRINNEIEASLAALEKLRPSLNRAEESPSPGPPEHSDLTLSEPGTVGPVEPAALPVPDSEEQVRENLEIFRHSLVSSKRGWIRSAGWTIAGTVLIGILGIAVLYYFISDSGTPSTDKKSPAVAAAGEPASPKPVSSPLPIPENAPAVTEPEKDVKPAETARVPDRQRNVHNAGGNDLENNTAAPARAGVATMAEPVRKVPPVYPAAARAQKIDGKVEVEAEISDSGDVFHVTAVSGPDALRAAAEEALLKWKFKPASVGGVNVPSKARIAVDFNLQ